MQTAIPCTWMRGGTSKGAYFQARDLPTDVETSDRVLLSALGSPHPRQIDGIGGADPLASKVAIVSASERPDTDVDYLFAQVRVDRPLVDRSISCGNLLAGVGPFAIETRLVPAKHPETRVRIFAVNTKTRVEAVVQTPDREVCYDGAAVIDGVPGTSAPVRLNYMDLVGTKTGTLLPTGQVREVCEGVEISCLDVSVPAVIIAATSLGKTGNETPTDLNGDREFLSQLERVRRAAAARMGLGDVTDKVMPKAALISTPIGTGIRSRYFVPHKCHAAHAVTGVICVACCAMLQGSVADGLARVNRSSALERVEVEHPSGKLAVDLWTEGEGPSLVIHQATLLRTVRPLFQGHVLIPASVWQGKTVSPARASWTLA